MQYKNIGENFTILIKWPIKQMLSDSIYNFRVIIFLKYESRRSNFLKDLKQSFEASRNGAPPEQAFDSFLSLKVMN